MTAQPPTRQIPADVVNLEDYARHAQACLPEATWAYLSGGAADELTLRANRQAWSDWQLHPRVLQPLQGAHLRTTLLGRALAFREANTRPIDDRAAFYDYFTPRNAEKPEIHGGFAMAHWCGAGECEGKIKEDLTVTIRCIPFDAPEESGRCICCGKESRQRVVFAKAY